MRWIRTGGLATGSTLSGSRAGGQVRTRESWPIQMKGPKDTTQTPATAAPSLRNFRTASLPLHLC